MAHLLGSKYCIESLRKDVSDVHETIADVFSRAGEVRHPSWKFPDKISADLDIHDLLEQYDYSEDTEERQVAHIVLLELVIERLILLIQAMTKYTDEMFAGGRATSAVQKGSNISVGLVVKKYWKKVVHLNTVLSQIQSENRSKTRKIVDLERTIEKLSQDIKRKMQDDDSPSRYARSKTPGFGGLIPPSNSELRFSQSWISKDCSHKSSQTEETAFVPCESCSRVQISLRKVGDSVIQLCKSNSLPSSLGKIKSDMDSIDWMSANDIARWTSEQDKDMNKINKHLSHLFGTIDPLKSDLETSQKTCDQLKDKLKDSSHEMKKERETQTIVRKQYEKKISEIKRQNSEVLDEEKRRNVELGTSKKMLESQVSDLKGELKKQVATLKDLEKAEQELRQDLERSQVRDEQLAGLEMEVNELQEKLSTVTVELSEASKSLAMEQAKGKSVSKHTQSLQAKQASLLQRVDELDEENRDLKNDVADLEDAKETLQDNLDRVAKEKKKLEIEAKESELLITELRGGKDALEQSIVDLKETIGVLENQVHDLTEREKLMIEYPDLNGPVNPDYSGTGDIALDMENQVKANSLRIQILEEQNEGLRNSITKLLKNSLSQHNVPPTAGPQPLWKPSNLEKYKEDIRHDVLMEEEEDHHHRQVIHNQNTPVYQKKQNSDVPCLNLELGATSKHMMNSYSALDHQARPPSGTAHKRPGSSKKQNSKTQAQLASKSSIAALLQLRNAGMLKSGHTEPGRPRPTSGGHYRPTVKYDPNYTAQDMFICAKCDKMYTSPKDLEIHRTYCRA